MHAAVVGGKSRKSEQSGKDTIVGASQWEKFFPATGFALAFLLATHSFIADSRSVLRSVLPLDESIHDPARRGGTVR